MRRPEKKMIAIESPIDEDNSNAHPTCARMTAD
jgi:hypothetical protein